MDKENLIFGDIEIEKYKFYHNKARIFFGGDVDIENVLVSNKISFREKKLLLFYWLLV